MESCLIKNQLIVKRQGSTLFLHTLYECISTLLKWQLGATFVKLALPWLKPQVTPLPTNLYRNKTELLPFSGNVELTLLKITTSKYLV